MPWNSCRERDSDLWVMVGTISKRLWVVLDDGIGRSC